MRRAAVVPPPSSMILSSARNASGTPLPECADKQQRRLLAGALERGRLLLDLLRRQRVDLVQRDDLGLVGQPVAIGFELGADGL